MHGLYIELPTRTSLSMPKCLKYGAWSDVRTESMKKTFENVSKAI